MAKRFYDSIHRTIPDIQNLEFDVEIVKVTEEQFVYGYLNKLQNNNQVTFTHQKNKNTRGYKQFLCEQSGKPMRKSTGDPGVWMQYNKEYIHVKSYDLQVYLLHIYIPEWKLSWMSGSNFSTNLGKTLYLSINPGAISHWTVHNTCLTVVSFWRWFIVGLTSYRYAVYALVAWDSHGHGFPLSYMILSTENTGVLQTSLAAFSKANPSFCPRYIDFIQYTVFGIVKDQILAGCY